MKNTGFVAKPTQKAEKKMSDLAGIPDPDKDPLVNVEDLSDDESSDENLMDEDTDEDDDNGDDQKKKSLSPEQLIDLEMSKYHVMQTTIRIMRFLQLLCEGHHKLLQNHLRE